MNTTSSSRRENYSNLEKDWFSSLDNFKLPRTDEIWCLKTYDKNRVMVRGVNIDTDFYHHDTVLINWIDENGLTADPLPILLTLRTFLTLYTPVEQCAPTPRVNFFSRIFSFVRQQCYSVRRRFFPGGTFSR